MVNPNVTMLDTTGLENTWCFNNMQQEEGEPLKLYIHRYSVIHKMLLHYNR